jgi:hypothetical protein
MRNRRAPPTLIGTRVAAWSVLASATQTSFHECERSRAQKIIIALVRGSREDFSLGSPSVVWRRAAASILGGGVALQRRGPRPLLVSQKLLQRRRLPSGALRRTGRDQERDHVARGGALQRRAGQDLAGSVLSRLRQGAERHTAALPAAVRVHSALVVTRASESGPRGTNQACL